MDNLIIERYRALAFITSISMKVSPLKLYRLIRHRRGDHRISHSVMLKLFPLHPTPTTLTSVRSIFPVPLLFLSKDVQTIFDDSVALGEMDNLKRFVSTNLAKEWNTTIHLCISVKIQIRIPKEEKRKS